MGYRFSSFGERFSRRTGALELMDDLGAAMSGQSPALMLGGGNPGRIPAVEAIFRQRLIEIAGDEEQFGRLLANYAHPAGELKFRRALAKLFSETYGWDVSPDNIALTAGSQAGFFLLFNLLAGRGSDGRLRKILLPLTPEYVGYADLGLEPDLFTSRRPLIDELEHDLFKYRVDFDELGELDDIGAVCLSRPTNPTGNVVTDNELSKLASVCREADVPLIVDNAYGLPFPGIVFGDFKPIRDDNMIYCLSLSKLGLPAARTGIVIAPEQIIEALTSMTAVVNLAVGSVGPTIVEPLVASGEILQICRNEVMPYYRDKALRSCDWLRRELKGLPFRIHKPEGAIFLWLWLPGLPIPSAELYRRIKDAGTFVLSGHYFFPGIEGHYPHRDECLRISFAQSDETVEAGIRTIAKEIARAFAV